VLLGRVFGGGRRRGGEKAEVGVGVAGHEYRYMSSTVGNRFLDILHASSL
jgi:hypothetical protein